MAVSIQILNVLKNITYLLGSGASVKALPVVSNMNSRILNFLQIFVDYQIKNDPNWNDPEIIELKESFIRVMSKAIDLATIDTYAKKLFLKEKRDDLLLIKSLISCYFLG